MAKEEKVSAEQVVRDIRRQTRKKYSAEEKIRIVLEGLRGEESIAELCRREGINPNMYYKWSEVNRPNEFSPARSRSTIIHKATIMVTMNSIVPVRNTQRGKGGLPLDWFISFGITGSSICSLYS